MTISFVWTSFLCLQEHVEMVPKSLLHVSYAALQISNHQDHIKFSAVMPIKMPFQVKQLNSQKIKIICPYLKRLLSNVNENIILWAPRLVSTAHVLDNSMHETDVRSNRNIFEVCVSLTSDFKGSRERLGLIIIYSVKKFLASVELSYSLSIAQKNFTEIYP
jgi:hypothetical protein